MTLNIKNLKKLRDFIAGMPAAEEVKGFTVPVGELSFSMTSWNNFVNQDEYADGIGRNHPCGTVMCIGGTADFLFKNGISAMTNLGLEPSQASELFYLECREDQQSSGIDPRWEATPERVVRVLDHLIQTGEVRWEAGGYLFDPAESSWKELPL